MTLIAECPSSRSASSGGGLTHASEPVAPGSSGRDEQEMRQTDLGSVPETLRHLQHPLKQRLRRVSRHGRKCTSECPDMDFVSEQTTMSAPKIQAGSAIAVSASSCRPRLGRCFHAALAASAIDRIEQRSRPGFEGVSTQTIGVWAQVCRQTMYFVGTRVKSDMSWALRKNSASSIPRPIIAI